MVDQTKSQATIMMSKVLETVLSEEEMMSKVDIMLLEAQKTMLSVTKTQLMVY